MSVDQDATLLWYFPSSSAQWTELLANSGIAVPDSLWLCQEDGTTGHTDLADSIGSHTLAKTAGSSSITYQDTVTGASRKAVTCAQASTRLFQNTDSTLPDIHTASCMVLFVVRQPTVINSNVLRSVLTLGPTFGSQLAVNINENSPGKYVVTADPNTSNDTTTSFNAIHPLLLQIDRTAGTATLQTDQATTSPTLTTTPTGKAITISGNNIQFWESAGSQYMYGAAWFNSNAELSAAKRTVLIQRMMNGFTTSHGTAAGVATASAVSPLHQGTGTSTAAATASAIGNSINTRHPTSAGVATASAVGASTATSHGTSAGATTTSAVGKSTAASHGTSAGAAIASAVGGARIAVSGTSAGAATASAVGAETVAVVGTSAGVGVASAVGASTAKAHGTSAGIGATTAVGAETIARSGISAGAAIAAAVGRSNAASVGTSIAVSVAIGIGRSPPKIEVLSPTPNTTPGTDTGMPAAYYLAKVTPIVVEVIPPTTLANLQLLTVSVKFTNGTSELVYYQGGFTSSYQKSYTIVNSGALILTIQRVLGWPAADANPKTIELLVDAVDVDGSLETLDTFIEMPGTAQPVAPVIVAPQAVDITAAALSRVIWQFKS